MRDRSGQEGFSLIETMVAMLVGITVISTISIAIKASHQASRTMDQKQRVGVVAGELLDLLFRIPVGEPSNPLASQAQRTELFDGDDDLGTTTLYGLRHGPLEEGTTFEVADFPYSGGWEVRVCGDLNADGDETDAEELLGKLLRVEILFAGRIVLQSARGRVLG